MGRIEEVAIRNGIPISDKKVEAARVVEMLHDKGLNVGRDAIYSVRSGRKTGRKISSKLEMTEVLGGDASKKDRFYGEVAEAGVLNRQVNQRGHYSTVNFSKGISFETDIAEADVNRSLRAMRTDLVLSEAKGIDPDIVDIFKEAAREYLAHYDYGYPSSAAVRDVSHMWDGSSMEDFYRACAVVFPTPHSLRTWMPYEAEVLLEFYRQRERSGSPLSELDRLTLEKNINRTPLNCLVDTVRSETGIPYDQVAHFTHTNALLYGRPTNPERSIANGHLVNGQPFLLTDAGQPKGHME